MSDRGTCASTTTSSPSASLFWISPFRLFTSPMMVPWNSVGARICSPQTLQPCCMTPGMACNAKVGGRQRWQYMCFQPQHNSPKETCAVAGTTAPQARHVHLKMCISNANFRKSCMNKHEDAAETLSATAMHVGRRVCTA